ncbi:MAG: hypothetical protein PVF56_16515 [Desulfobacterales bacterium]|jgi:hypothetical protein
MLKKTVIIILIGLIYFALSVGIMPFAMMIETAGQGEVQTPSAMFRALAGLTKG